MTLLPGTRLGPYEILAPIGAGGMGEVYRARDPRLSREVAIKVLPAALASDGDRRNRFETEARSASALSHPGIVTIYDIGSADSTVYIAMELVEGRTLREIASAGPLPLKRALSIGAQAAEALAKAHAAGIVHRDLKPENLMVSTDGFVKILDFGLAKLVAGDSGGLSHALTLAPQTGSGVILGTVSYMSPEQAGGAEIDFRSDQFALGTILYEIVTGRHPFTRSTAIDTLSAIRNEEPEPVAAARPEAPLALRWVIERCLAKEPDERYASTLDLARDLRMLQDHLAESGASQALAVGPRKRRSFRTLVGLLPAAALLVFAGLLLGKHLDRKPAPSFRQLAFRQGTIRSARFSPDGETVVYGAAWGGAPIEVFTVRPGTPVSRPLGQVHANVLAVSPSGELALQLRIRHAGFIPGHGTLARMPLEGGAAPRELLEDVSWADWSPDGSSLAIVRHSGSRQRLEYPAGKVLYETSGWISHPRVSPDGLRVAYIDHPIPGDDRGAIGLVDRGARKTLGGNWASVWGLAWAPGGKELWFAGAKVGAQRDLFAISLSGKQRVIARLMASLSLHDISRDGRVLLSRDNIRFGVRALRPGAKEETDLSWLDVPAVSDISRDGRAILFFEGGEGGGEGYGVYLRGTDGSPAALLGSGRVPRFSPDEKWALTSDIRADPPQLVLLPTGPGEPVAVTRDRLTHLGGFFLPDGKRIVFAAEEPGRPRRLYVQAISGGAPQPISTEGVAYAGRVSPDGRFVLARDQQGTLNRYPISPGNPLPVAGVAEDEFAIQWSADGKSLYVQGLSDELPEKVFRVDLASGKRELWKEFAPSDPTGVVEIQLLAMTPDARSYAYTYVRLLSDLYVAEGFE